MQFHERLAVVVVSRMPTLLHVVEQLQAVNHSGIFRNHIKQRTKRFELPRQRSTGGALQYIGPVDYVLRKL